jgi:hypothetical protein
MIRHCCIYLPRLELKSAGGLQVIGLVLAFSEDHGVLRSIKA